MGIEVPHGIDCLHCRLVETIKFWVTAEPEHRQGAQHVLSALSGATAEVLSSCPDPRIRQRLTTEFEELMRQQTALRVNERLAAKEAGLPDGMGKVEKAETQH